VVDSGARLPARRRSDRRTRRIPLGDRTRKAGRTTVRCDDADFPRTDPWASVAALTAEAVPWQTALAVADLLALWSAAWLLAGLQSRRILVAVVRETPSGLMTIRRDGHVRLEWAPVAVCGEPRSRS
jgi:hypothetical protein